MIARFIFLNIAIAVLFWGIGRIMTTPELRQRMYYPLFLILTSTLVSVGLVILERVL